MHRCDQAKTVRTVPVPKNMWHREVWSPASLVEIKPVLLETSQIDDTGIGAAGVVVRCRLAYVVPTGSLLLGS